MDSSFPTWLQLIHKEILITARSFSHFAPHCSSVIPPCLGESCIPAYCFSCELNWHMRGGTSLMLDGGESSDCPQDSHWYYWGNGGEFIIARWRLKSRYPTQSSLTTQERGLVTAWWGWKSQLSPWSLPPLQQGLERTLAASFQLGKGRGTGSWLVLLACMGMEPYVFLVNFAWNKGVVV